MSINRNHIRKALAALTVGCIVTGVAYNANAQLGFSKSIQVRPISLVSDVKASSSIATLSSIAMRERRTVVKPAVRPVEATMSKAFARRESNLLRVSKQVLPDIEDVKLFRLQKEVEGRFNAVTQIRFKAGQESSILKKRAFTFSGGGKEQVHFNDDGMTPDIAPGDGVFSAFARVDFAKIALDDAALAKRMLRSKVSSVPVFSGRVVESVAKLDVNRILTRHKAKRLSEVVFDKGLVGTRIPLLPGAFTTIPFTSDEGKVLGINHVSVVEHPDFTFDPCSSSTNSTNPNVPWSFKTLMANLNNTLLSDQQFTHEWIRNWMADGSVNGQVIGERPSLQSFFVGWNGVNASTLDMDNLPFRLLSVMNRMDLAKVSYGGASGGETRFVFGLIDGCSARPMTVIFEYGDTAQQCTTIKSRSQQWLDLDALALGSPAYMNALKAITDDVTQSPVAASAINQLRTNEFVTGNDWELREFIIDGGTGLLSPTTVKQTPAIGFRNNQFVTAQYIAANANAILCETHTVPEMFNSAPFLGASIEYLPNTSWRAPLDSFVLPSSFPGCYNSNITSVATNVSMSDQIKSEVRHKFSLNTCDDCHSAETGTFFTHVSPFTRSFSGFMTGNTVGDPWLFPASMGGIDRSFDDLQRRGQIVQNLAARQCGGGLMLGFRAMQNQLQALPTH